MDAEHVGEHVNPRHAYRGKPGYGVGKPWHERVQTWTSRDGKVVKLRNLADSHLENIILFLRRKAERAQICGIAGALSMMTIFDGESATDVIDAELRTLTDTTPEEMLAETPVYRALCREADRRAALLGLVPAAETPVYPTEHHKPRRALSQYDEKYILNDEWGDD